MFCPHCGQPLTEGGAFCPFCGRPVPAPQHPELAEPAGTETEQRFGGSWFWITLLGSLGLTAILTLVFHLPIFILGAFLPFFWVRRPSPRR